MPNNGVTYFLDFCWSVCWERTQHKTE